MIKSGYSPNLINESANPKADLKSKINQIAVSLNKNGKDGPSRYNQYNLRELALAIVTANCLLALSLYPVLPLA